jgi:RHS repeat-associated protein
LLDQRYEYTSNNKVNEVYEANVLLKSYKYTAAGQVESVNDAEFYSYDPNGNLLTLENQASGLKKEYVFNTADQLLTQKVYQNLVLSKEISYQYDTNGNLVKAVEAGTEGVTTNYGYNATNQLIKITKEQNGSVIQTIDYEYDANGARAKKTSGGTVYTYQYEDGRIVKEEITDNGNTTTINYQTDEKGNLLNLNVNGTNYYYQFNNRGDTVALTDPAGNIVAKYDYDTWGNVTILSDTSPEGVATLNPYRYVGKYGVQYDKDTNMYLMSWRDYDPNSTRFIVPDTLDGKEDEPFSKNKYLYAEGDPVNNIDPDGHFVIPAVFVVVAFAAALLLTYAVVTSPSFQDGAAQLWVKSEEAVRKEIEDVREKVTTTYANWKPKPKKKKRDPATGIVYTRLVKDKQGEIHKYIGITKNEGAYKQRVYKHKRWARKNRFKWVDMYPLEKKIRLSQLRAKEQIYINAFGGVKSLQNKINSISKLYWDEWEVNRI